MRVLARPVFLLAVLFAACASPRPAPLLRQPASPTPEVAAGGAVDPASTSFRLTSPQMSEGGNLPVEFTCDGVALTPPLRWGGAPPGTVSFAVVMHHEAAPNDVHWYWVLYDVPPDVDHIDAGAPPPGALGTNSVNDRREYTPPCSKGPGPKRYTFTVYALSGHPTVGDPRRVSRPVLLKAIEGMVLGQASLDVTYSRP